MSRDHAATVRRYDQIWGQTDEAARAGILDEIWARNPDGARRAMHRLMDLTERNIIAALSRRKAEYAAVTIVSK